MSTAVAVQPVPITPTEFLYRDLVSEELWERLVGRIVKDEGVEREEAERIMDAALGFLKLCADHPGQRFVPSKSVDIGWHTFLMYTSAYHAFCDRYAGRFIHHEPNDQPDEDSGVESAHSTVEFMKTHGISFDPELWPVDGAKCRSQCRASCKACFGGPTSPPCSKR